MTSMNDVTFTAMMTWRMLAFKKDTILSINIVRLIVILCEPEIASAPDSNISTSIAMPCF